MLADFRGVKKVYYNGSYHDSVRFGNELIWEVDKKMEGILHRSEVDLTGLTGVDIGEFKSDVNASNDEYGSIFYFSTPYAQTVRGVLFDYNNKEILKFISINDWFIEVDSEEIELSGMRGLYFQKEYPPSYLERLVGLPFPYGTFYKKEKLTEHNKISVWIKEEV